MALVAVVVAVDPKVEVVRAAEQRGVGVVKAMAVDGQVELAIRQEEGGVMHQPEAVRSRSGARSP